MLATGTGPIPHEYGLPQPRVAHGDRAVVRNGALSADAVLAPQPPRPFIWGAPDLHFLKVFTLCVMAFAAVMVMVRERIAELKLAKVELVEEDIFYQPRLARWSGHEGFSGGYSAPRPAIAKRDLDRIKRFGREVKAMKEREALMKDLIAPRSYGVLAMLSSRDDGKELSGIFGSLGRGSSVDNALVGGVVEGGVSGGFGLIGRGEGGGGSGGIGLGSIGTIGGGTGFGMGGLGRRGGLRMTVERGSSYAGRILSTRRYVVESCLGDFHGSFSTTIDLAENGAVMSVAVSGVPDDAQRCVARKLEQLQFASSDVVGSITARWTRD